MKFIFNWLMFPYLVIKALREDPIYCFSWQSLADKKHIGVVADAIKDMQLVDNLTKRRSELLDQISEASETYNREQDKVKFLEENIKTHKAELLRLKLAMEAERNAIYIQVAKEISLGKEPEEPWGVFE